MVWQLAPKEFQADLQVIGKRIGHAITMVWEGEQPHLLASNAVWAEMAAGSETELGAAFKALVAGKKLTVIEGPDHRWTVNL